MVRTAPAGYCGGLGLTRRLRNPFPAFYTADGKVCWDCDLPYDDIDESGIHIEGLKDYLKDYVTNMEV